jgi:predicted transcriptional regulator
MTNSANGTMSYHLAELEKSSQIAVIRKKNVTRYYPSDMSQQVSNVISYLRNPISRQIISLLVSKSDGCAFDEFTRSITRVPSTIHWHLQRLIDAGIIKKDFMHYSDGSNRSSRLYYLPEREIVKDILSKYVETPLDKLVANYSNLIDDL